MKLLENKRKAMEARSCDRHAMNVRRNARNAQEINVDASLSKEKESNEEDTLLYLPQQKLQKSKSKTCQLCPYLGAMRGFACLG